MYEAAAVSNVDRNNFLSRPMTKKDIKDGKRGLFHNLPEELKVTAMIAAMENAPETRQSNRDALEKQREHKKKKEELARAEGMEKASNAYLDAMIYHSKWGTDACWETIGGVTKGLKNLNWQKDKYQALKDKILIRFRGFGWEHWKLVGLAPEEA